MRRFQSLIRWSLRKSVAFIVARPALRHRINQILQRFPGLYKRLLGVTLAQSGSHTYEGEPRVAPSYLKVSIPVTSYVQRLAVRLQAVHGFLHRESVTPSAFRNTANKPKLAFVTPLPPLRTGIADYSVELLPFLAKHYDIYLISDQKHTTNAWASEHGPIYDAAWLRAHANAFERVIYQMGNYHLHAFMLPLMQEVPGVVVLHDFYLSGLFSYLEEFGGMDYAWVDALYASHDYLAVQQRFADTLAAKRDYPANFAVLVAAQGVIVHSQFSRRLAQQWYGTKVAKQWAVIPHLRVPISTTLDQLTARQQLGLDKASFVVCSFGFLNPSKLNHRLLTAWLQSELMQHPQCILIFAGENYQGEYGLELLRLIKQHGVENRVFITGFLEADAFKLYLAAADVAVQLRTDSRGESSGTVLDAMNHGLPLIINANGAMAEVDSEAVVMLPDAFEDVDLQHALEVLWQSPEQRQRLSQRAKAAILAHHDPARCAQRYAEVIEASCLRAQPPLAQQIQQAAACLPVKPTPQQYAEQAIELAKQYPEPRSASVLYLDITATSRLDLKTGIERVTRALLLALLTKPPMGYRVEPVYLTYQYGQWVYQYARLYTLNLLQTPPVLCDEVVGFQAGDVLLGLDVSGAAFIQAQATGLFERLRDQRVRQYMLVHDILPIRMPEVFPPGAEQAHTQWAQAIATLDGIVGVSQTVSEDFAAWMAEQFLSMESFLLTHSHHGADVENSAPTTGLPADAQAVLAQLAQQSTFLMVGTIEPRKGYEQVLHAFTQLWEQGVAVNLVIVGQEGWQGLADSQRRTIPQIVTLLQQHPELNKRLFWLSGISDEYLEQVYAASTCLIAASKGEGFGLPLIEAAQHGVPLLLRDIPVFKEVAGEHAAYFTGSEPEALAAAVQQWLRLYEQGQHPTSEAMPWLTWEQSAQQLVKKLLI